MEQGVEEGKDNTSDLIKILTEKTWFVEGEVAALSLAADEEKFYQHVGRILQGMGLLRFCGQFRSGSMECRC